MNKQQPLFRLFISLVVLTASLASGKIYAQDCNNGFYNMKEGASFTLTTFDAKNKPLAKSVHKYRKIDRTGNGFSAQMDQELINSDGQSISVDSYEMACQDGIIKLNVKDVMMSGMNLQNVGVRMEVSGDALELPSSLSVGQTLKDASFHMKGTMGEMKLMDRTFLVKERKVEGTETLETPAGKFDCFKVSYLMETTGMMGKTRTIKSVTWYAKGPGMVKNESYDEKGKLTGYSMLTAYSN